MPSKLLAMLASGRPVITTAPPDSEIAYTLVAAGVITPPEEPVPLGRRYRRSLPSRCAGERWADAAFHFARTSMDAETILRKAEARMMELAGTGLPAGAASGERVG